ncbi:MAG: 50S ribosomal protein L29 [candidate division WS2 bacterium ADurb.Bin280]|uniref:Large ribosomal subunit protein uL29 n=1 Tax=candidate division WS2 bacterium ADurb.Bin280 TaxID=1852829 RepID=A0A1V5SF13_9BACT|nr:MAG: 50S ribosomal protein L29 [candidate division WS2 bacterium ADurb.Bin280]
MKSKTQEFRKLSYKDLLVRCDQIERELFNLRAKSATGAENSSKTIKQLRYDLSTAKTVANEKKYEELIERKNG